MIQLEAFGGKTSAVIICDVCHNPITNAGMALVQWPAKQDGSITRLLYCHKGECDASINQFEPVNHWWELEHFLARLLASTGMDAGMVKTAMREAVSEFIATDKPICLHESVTTDTDSTFFCNKCRTTFFNDTYLEQQRAMALRQKNGQAD